MAEKRVDLPVTAEVTKSCGVELRRYSTGKASSGHSEEKVVPHYLRASTGSCHDLCKYGRKHEFDVKGTYSIPKTTTRKALHQSSEESIGGIMKSAAKLRASVDSKPTKISDVKLRESMDSALQISDTSDTIKQELSTNSPDSKKLTGNLVLVNRNTVVSLAKVKPSNSTSRKVETPSKSTSKMGLTPSKSSFHMVKTSSKPTSKKVETSPNLSSLKGEEMELSEKHVISLNPNSVTVKTISSMSSSEGFGGQRDSGIEMEKREASSKVASRKLMAPLRASLSPKPSSIRIASINAGKQKSRRIVSCLKNQPEPRNIEPKEHNNEVEEKTLHVIKMESENKTLQSDQNANVDIELSLSQSLSSPKFSTSSSSQSSSEEEPEESEYATSEFEEGSFLGNREIEYMENGETMVAKENGKPQKDVIVCSEDKDCQMLKSKVSRGKLVETQIEKSSNGTNVTASSQRKSFKRRDGAGADSTGATTGPEKVVLRHQEVQGKKDGQGLFNIVIEETANKLVETRKSKVKALVGAFETVISLQEKKTSANTVS